jgi:anti-anti-sigma regulatory factor
MVRIREKRISRLSVGRKERDFLVCVQGRGTIKLSPLLHHFAVQSFETGTDAGANAKHSTVTVDLTDCDYLDSTFLGCLLSLNRRFNRVGDPRFLIAASPEKRRELLEPSSLDRVLTIRETNPEPGCELIELVCPALLNTDLGRHVLECHRQLAQLGGSDQAAFRSVVDQLSNELDVALPGWM